MEMQSLGCWFRTSVWPLAGDGGVDQVLHLWQDATDRVAAEAALAASEKNLRNMFDDSPEGILSISASGKLLDLNRAARELLGDHGDSTAGIAPDWDATWGLSGWQELAGELRDHRAIKNREVILRGVDGVERTALLTAHAAHDDGDNDHRIQAIIKDVSAYKRAEAMMLQGMKLDSLGRLAGGIAHDFNNALTVIRGYADLTAASVAGNSVAVEYLIELQRTVDKASGLTRQLLVFSNTEGVDTHLVDPGEVIAEKASELARQAGDNFSIEHVVAPDLWPVEADVGLLGQVLTIMVKNAEEAMPDGGTIQVAAENISPDRPAAGAIHDQSVRITIRDDGEGITPENLARVFDPFFTTREASSSTGMGLAIAHSIVRQHGGWIDVESAPGEGSSFSIHLPRIDADQEEAAAMAPQPAARPSGRKVLLVEDEPGVREVAATWLSRNGYQVFAAHDAREARVIFKRGQGDFDLVFSDLVMPGESGLNLVLSLLEQKPELCAIIASGYGGDDARQAEIEARGIQFMQKPYALVELLEQIDRMLDQ